MKNETVPSKQRSTEKGGNVFPAFCSILGTLLLVAVILTAVPLTVPRLLGYEIYNVVSGSMAPAIPVGSVILVSPAAPEQVREGDVIAFRSGGAVIAHRVVRSAAADGEFVTKGDANETEDFNTVPYADLLGKVVIHVPVLGELMSLYASPGGKIYALGVAGCGLLFNLLAGAIRERQREALRRRMRREMKNSSGNESD